MHLYNGRETGWCLTQKLALYDAQGKIIGMAGISHDLQEAGPITRPTNGWRRSTCTSAATTHGRSHLRS